MTSAELVLQKAADDGSLDSAEWPQTLQYILDRLDEIITDFPKPPADFSSTPPASNPNPDSSNPRPQASLSSQESTATDKENAPPQTPPRPPVPAFSASTSTSAVPESQTFPQDTVNFYSSIRSNLSTNFSKNPPHTIQRLAELILDPKKRYRFLPPYLRALDRVVSVSSPVTLFPLPQAVLPSAGGLLNGTTTPTPQAATLGSDESLGGALLTPIPWLQNRGQNELISESTEMVDGPNGAGRIETVTVGMMNGGNGNGNGNGNGTSSGNNSPTSPTAGVSQIASAHPEGETLPSTGPVTQGEILRQEQEAGVVLNNPHSLTTNPMLISEADGGGSGPSVVVDTVEGEEETPHARGPEAIGMEDTGPQKSSGGLDIEGAVGRPSIERSSKSPAPPESVGSADEEMKEGDEDKDEEKEDKKDESKDAEKEEEKDVDMKTAE